MKKKHLTGTTAFHPGVPLKPLVIAVSTALGMAARPFTPAPRNNCNNKVSA